MAEEKKKEEAPAAPPKDKAKLMQIVFLVLNLGVMGAGLFMVYKSTLGFHPPVITDESLAAETEKAATEAEKGQLLFTMDKFTVNLGGEPRRSIRLEINLEMLTEDSFEEIMRPENRAKARDRILRLLGEKSFTELETMQGKLFLKDKIAQEINTMLAGGVVKDVFYTDFVVQ